MAVFQGFVERGAGFTPARQCRCGLNRIVIDDEPKNNICVHHSHLPSTPRAIASSISRTVSDFVRLDFRIPRRDRKSVLIFSITNAPERLLTKSI